MHPWQCTPYLSNAKLSDTSRHCLTILSLAGDVSHPFVIVSGSTKSKAWAKMWPEAHITATERGSITAELFTEAVVLWEDYVLLKKEDPVLENHLRRLSIDPFMYMLPWLRLLFSRIFVIDEVIALF